MPPNVEVFRIVDQWVIATLALALKLPNHFPLLGGGPR